jgi:hypothetical protein
VTERRGDRIKDCIGERPAVFVARPPGSEKILVEERAY